MLGRPGRADRCGGAYARSSRSQRRALSTSTNLGWCSRPETFCRREPGGVATKILYPAKNAGCHSYNFWWLGDYSVPRRRLPVLTRQPHPPVV